MSDLHARLDRALDGRYAIERQLGRGGMAIVYLARDLRHRRTIALKVLLPDLAQTLGPERFLREIEIAARLIHPRIVPLLDSDTVDGLLHYAMPFVDGESLRQRLEREKQLPVEDALEVARQVASALAYAHGHGVVHRDIKPENILLSGGEALVADFGIARAVRAAGGARLTQSGLALGTVAYMSPEQASGAEDVDARSDVYSLACVLYEMLAGEPPFTGPTAQAITARKLRQAPTTITVLRDNVSAPVAVALSKALSPVPADRHSSATQFADALRAPAPSSHSQEGHSPALRRSAERVLWLALGAAATLLVAVGVRQGTAWRNEEPASLVRMSVSLPPDARVTPAITRPRSPSPRMAVR